jgi:diguanylate cyclase (GGDEF)-like protein
MLQKFQYVELNVFALSVLLLIYLNIGHRRDHYLLEQKLFVALIGADALILVPDTFMWLLDGISGVFFRAVFQFASACYYSLNPVICFVWLCYVNYQIYRSTRQLKKLLMFSAIPLAVNILLSFLSIFTGTLFYIDGSNTYHRGLFFMVMVLISFAFLLYTLLLILLKQRRFEKNNFIPILAFYIPPLVGGIVQTIFFGVSVIWISVTISILVIFINIQNYQLDIDYLTGVFNRRQLDHYLQQQAQAYSEKKLLAGIMIDLDAFKIINDRFGHDAGDEALKYVAGILKKTFRKHDFIARYGGDEFIVLMDIKDASDLNRAVRRLKENVGQFNKQKVVPYNLSLSIGYDTFTPAPSFTLQNFMKHIDSLMYLEKIKHGGKVPEPAKN